MADYTPVDNGNLRFILIYSYSETSDRPGGRSSGRSTSLENGKFRFIPIDSYSENSGSPGGISSGRSLPPRIWQFQIHTDRFLLSELRMTRWQIKWQIYPLRK